MSCFVCDFNPSKNNKIATCVKCDLTIHQKCYGLRLKDVKFTCEFCKHGEGEKQCVLCPLKKGPLKKTTDKRWAHIVCALFTPNVYFKNAQQMRHIDVFKLTQRTLTIVVQFVKVTWAPPLNVISLDVKNVSMLPVVEKKDC